VDWRTHTLKTLETAGYRRGGARAAVVDVLAAEDCCLSAQEIHDRLRAEGRPTGIASVYRVLELLSEHHLVQKVDVGGSVAHYERHDPTGHHHHHVVCDRCGAVAVFEDERLEDELERITESLGYAIEGHDVILRGVCSVCRGAKRPRRRNT
jgi:Fur family ferric uptake transcriptional regulator